MFNNPYDRPVHSTLDNPFIDGMLKLAGLVVITSGLYCASAIIRYPFDIWDNHLYERTTVSAKIEEVRIITSTDTYKQSNGEGGHPIAGAVIGGLVTGDILGAIAGGAIGSDIGKQQTKQVQVRHFISGCYMVAKTSDGGIFRESFGSVYSNFCSVAKKGDMFNLEKVTTRSSGTSEYIFDHKINQHFFN